MTSPAQPEPAPTSPLASELDALRSRVEDAVKTLDAARKALEVLARPGTLDSIPQLDKARDRLERSDLSPLGLEGERQALLAQLGEQLQGLRARARHEVLSGLRDLCRAVEVPFDVIGTEPPVAVLNPLTAELDPDNGKAIISFAREPVLETELNARAILDGRQRAMDTIKAGALPSEQFFELLRTAWRTVLLADGKPPGERIDLVDVLGPLSVLRLSRDAWRRVDGSRLEGYPRYLLAYQLYRLRRDGCLERDQVRLDLGAATGGSTRNKRNVLYVPTTPTDGQYYLTIRFNQG